MNEILAGIESKEEILSFREPKEGEGDQEFASWMGEQIRAGSLSKKMYKSLPKPLQELYRKFNTGKPYHVKGVPMSHREREAYDRMRAKRKRRNKLERRARKEMYRARK